jgi:hypothetical protein
MNKRKNLHLTIYECKKKKCLELNAPSLLHKSSWFIDFCYLRCDSQDIFSNQKPRECQLNFFYFISIGCWAFKW